MIIILRKVIILATFFRNTVKGWNSCLRLHCFITLASDVRSVFQVHERHLPRSSRSGHSGDVSEKKGRFRLVPVRRSPRPFWSIHFGAPPPPPPATIFLGTALIPGRNETNGYAKFGGWGGRIRCILRDM